MLVSGCGERGVGADSVSGGVRGRRVRRWGLGRARGGLGRARGGRGGGVKVNIIEGRGIGGVGVLLSGYDLHGQRLALP